MNKILIIIVSILLFSCSSNNQIIKEKPIEIEIPQITDTLKNAEFKNIDTIVLNKITDIFQELSDSAYIGAEKEIAIKDKKVKTKVKYFPKKNEFSLNLDKFQIDTTIIDTQKITIKKEISTIEKFGYVGLGIIGFLFLIIIIIYKLKK